MKIILDYGNRTKIDEGIIWETINTIITTDKGYFNPLNLVKSCTILYDIDKNINVNLVSITKNYE